MKLRSILILPAALALSGAALILTPHRALADANDTLNAADVKFVKEQAAAGAAELKLAELAVKKATNADVKAFAEMMVTDHTKANEELGALAKKKGVEVSAIVDPGDAKKFQNLEQESGDGFDKAFVKEMKSAHKKCVKDFEDASKDAKDGDLKAWVNKTLPTLKAHLDHVEKLK